MKASYTRGTDLSGSLEGAGGIGGLLARSVGDFNTNTTLTIYITNNSTLNFEFWIYSDAGTNVDDAFVSAGTTSSFTLNAFAGVAYTIDGFDHVYHAIEVLDTFAASLDHHALNIEDNAGDFDTSESGSALCGPAGNWSRNDFYFADANGNITALVDTNQSLSAQYRYDPFGNTISQSGIMADANVYRFSSKEIHLASGMYYYGYRFYDPSLQRWVNRDPRDEPGFNTSAHRSSAALLIAMPPTQNPYAFCRGSSANFVDPLGLDEYSDCLQNCTDKDRNRIKTVDHCAAWGAGIGGGGAALGGALVGAGNGRALSTGAVWGTLAAASWGLTIEAVGRLGTLLPLMYCANHCADSYLPPPVWPTTWPDPF